MTLATTRLSAILFIYKPHAADLDRFTETRWITMNREPGQYPLEPVTRLRTDDGPARSRSPGL